MTLPELIDRIERGENGRPCTCHPDDAPSPCQHKYAAGDCQESARLAAPLRTMGAR